MTLPGLISQQSILRNGEWLGVPDSRQWTQDRPCVQLQMVWPESRLTSPPVPRVPAGYELRCWRPDDEPQWLELMNKVDLGDWDHDRLVRTLPKILPDGFFVIEHKPSRRIVATAMATHSATEQHPFGGELGWVAGDPQHQGRGLGMAVCAAVTARLLRAGYHNIYLRTDDHRLPAIKTYLKLGFVPLLFCDGMRDRWQDLFRKIAWPGPLP